MNTLILLLPFLSLIFSGCKATYPKEKVEESIQKICLQEYKLRVVTRIDGFTVFAYIPIQDFMPEITLLAPDTVEQLSHVMHSLSRVVLSSDAPFQFIVLYAADVASSGSALTFIRCVDDIRRMLTGDISHDEYFDRLVIRTALSPADPPVENISQTDFLAEQIAQRLKKTLTKKQPWSSRYTTTAVSGKFIPLPPETNPSPGKATRYDQPQANGQPPMPFIAWFIRRAQALETYARKYIKPLERIQPNNQYGYFEFKVDMSERILFILQQNINGQEASASAQALEDLHRAVIQPVLRSYQFDNFKEIRLINLSDNKTVVIPKSIR